jgi:alpha-amylase
MKQLTQCRPIIKLSPIMAVAFLMSALFISCKNQSQQVPLDESTAQIPYFNWEGATIYFMLTDRFNNGDRTNDVNFDRTESTAVLRGFEGGDLAGIIQKIEEGYFNELGVHALWMTPLVEQIHAGTDEGTGFTYGYHGYWAKDWTALDPNFGTIDELKTLVDAAHRKGIRVLLDAVVNHHGPQTELDGIWPEDWVRRGPTCTHDSYAGATSCNLVENLPDVLTESNQEVALPPQLVAKWQEEGRLDQEIAELDAFFERTGYPRAPRFYIMKWLSDYVTDFGIDGFRVDTAKHTEVSVWEEFRVICDAAFAQWKNEHPEAVLDQSPFYLVGEVYSYDLHHLKDYDFGDRKENFFNNSFDALINFHIKGTQAMSLEELFSDYSNILNGPMDGFGTLNFMSSHDDGSPFDKDRNNPYETARRLLLAPGAAQIYYGDELARPLIIEGTQGDATLRSFMNWADLENKAETQKILKYWQRLGQFRARHMAIGAGVHQQISETPYTFSRTLKNSDHQDRVVVAVLSDADIKLAKEGLRITVGDVFAEGTEVHDAFTGQKYLVTDGGVTLKTFEDVVLLESVL